MTTKQDHDQDGTVVERSVTTTLDVLRQDAALAANLNPMKSDVVDAAVTENGELELILKGESL